MTRVPYVARLTSLDRYGGQAPPTAVGETLRLLPSAVRQSIRMGFTGRSAAKGNRPSWLTATADIRLVGYDGDRDYGTRLYFEAPTFGEAAEELYAQSEFWPTKPPPEDTGFDLLGDVLTDVTAGAEDSQRFDRPLLKRLFHFQKVLVDGFEGLHLGGHRLSKDAAPTIDASTIAAAKRLYEETPLPKRARVVGRLDMIWQSRQGFMLVLDDGQEVRGVLIGGDPSALTAVFNQRVVVYGRAVYRPSGSLLRLDADIIEPGAEEPKIWSRIPQARGRKMDLRPLTQLQTPKSGLAAIFGKWPGEETDDEILATLKRMG